jgi:hypothetical protein
MSDPHGKPLRTAVPVVPFIAVLAVLLTSCSGSDATPLIPSSAGSSSRTDPGAPVPAPVPLPPKPSPVGSTEPVLLGRGHGVGPGSVRLVRRPAAGSRPAVRFVCVGPTGLSVTDPPGRLFMRASRCANGLVSTVEWTWTPKDPGTIRIETDRATNWALEIWSGRPVSSTDTGPSA